MSYSGNDNRRKKVVIAGGGTAGWMAAAALSRLLGHHLDVVLVESEEIGTVGVGEATIPTMQTFHLLLKIDEREFIEKTNATFKLGIQFENWGAIGESYLHAFGETGKESWAGQFQHFWLRGKKEGINLPFGAFCLEHQAALASKFAITKNPRLNYAYHLDAGLYARYLRELAEAAGVQRIEGKIREVETSKENGFIDALCLESGQRLEGDLFIDCTGFRALLIQQALNSGFESWEDLLHCNSAIAVQTELTEAPLPYTRSIAHASGWQWKIPLQSRVGNGLVYSNTYLSDDNAKELLLNNVTGSMLTEPRIIRFVAGRCLRPWNKNCVALGLASGFIEPLESTAIHLISSAIVRLMRLIPLDGINEMDAEEYNRQAEEEMLSVRDFIVLHYKVTRRDDSDFWRDCSNLEVPDSLKNRMNLYADSARLFWGADELFTVSSWNQVMLGQGLVPSRYHPVADVMASEELRKYLYSYAESINKTVESLPEHGNFVRQLVFSVK